MPIKTPEKYDFTPSTMSIIKITSLGKDMEKAEPLCTAAGNVKW